MDIQDDVSEIDVREELEDEEGEEEEEEEEEEEVDNGMLGAEGDADDADSTGDDNGSKATKSAGSSSSTKAKGKAKAKSGSTTLPALVPSTRVRGPVETLIELGNRQIALRAYEEALSFYCRALQRLPESPLEATLRLALLLNLGEASLLQAHEQAEARQQQQLLQQQQLQQQQMNGTGRGLFPPIAGATRPATRATRPTTKAGGRPPTRKNLPPPPKPTDWLEQVDQSTLSNAYIEEALALIDRNPSVDVTQACKNLCFPSACLWWPQELVPPPDPAAAKTKGKKKKGKKKGKKKRK